MVTRKHKQGALSIIVCMALVAVMTVPFAAYADTGDTNVKLQIDNSNLSVTIPANMVVWIEGSGTLTYPTGVQFENESIFDVRVESLSVAQSGSYQVLSQTAYGTSSDSDVLYTMVTPEGSGTTPVDLTAGSALPASEWTIAKQSGATPTAFGVTFDGEIKNISSPPTTATDAYKITWTVAAV